MPTKNMPSKTPAPPIEIIPGKDFLAFEIFKISPPIRVPRTPIVKAPGAINSEAKIKAKKTENKGGAKKGITIPLPGTIFATYFTNKDIRTLTAR